MTASQSATVLRLALSKVRKGHEGRLPLPRLNARFAFSEETFARPHGNGQDAPIPAVRGTAVEPPDSGGVAFPGDAVPMVSDGGTFKVPVTINGQLTLKFVVDI